MRDSSAGEPAADPLAGHHGEDTLVGKVPLPATAFERYQIKRLIGSGGMGLVYEALDLSLHRVVALKVVKLSDFSPGELTDAANRLVREARAMAVLSHRNVVAVYDVGVQDEQVYVAMQLVDGTTLRGWLGAAPRTVSQTLRIMCDAGAGLAAAHAARLVHRDFKPDNVLVSRRGTARVTDFGLARRADFDVDTGVGANHDSGPRIEHQDANVTQTGTVIGTPAYMAPEQAAGKVCDARADQFSFCVTTWEALFGVRPFAGTTWSEIHANVLAGNVVEPDSSIGVPRLIQRALRRGMVVEPAGRFLNMVDLLEVLETGIAKPLRWRWFAAIAVASAVIAGVLVWTVKGGGPVDPPASPVATTIRPSPPPKLVTTPIDPPPPVDAHPPLRVIPPIDPTPDPPVVVTPPVRHQRIATRPETAKPAPVAADPAIAALAEIRSRRANLGAELRSRHLRPDDLGEPARAAIASVDSAIAAKNPDRASEQLEVATKAIAAITIDRAFVDRKLARLNDRFASASATHKDELSADYKRLLSLVQGGRFTDANALLDEIADKLSSDR